MKKRIGMDAYSRIDQAPLEKILGELKERAQWEVDQHPSLKRLRANLERSFPPGMIVD
jgi:hypothetical protein